MKMIAQIPIPLAVRLAPDGWEILAPPGPLPQLLKQLSRDKNSLSVEMVNGQTMAVVPFTDNLDQSLIYLVDALIALRYQTGQVQLELFALEEV